MNKLVRMVVDRKFRFSILTKYGVLDWMSDEAFLKKSYKIKTGKILDLKHPTSFNEKLQWLKLYDRKPEYTMMVDKYEVKKYVSTILGKECIIPTLGVWDQFDDIDFESLPNQFVLKCTHDSGGLVIVRDKSKLNKIAAKNKIQNSLKRNYYRSGREWPYKNVRPRIIAEQYMDDGNNGLRDYKFFTFNGESKFIYLSEGLENHPTAKISFFDLSGEMLPFKRNDYAGFDGECEFPANFEMMRLMSDKLSKAIDCPFVRLDFYNIKGHIYFSEITFSPCSGMIPFFPSEWDEKLGKLIKLPFE